LERNPYYWHPDRPYLDRLVFRSVANEQSAFLSLLSGDAHVVEGTTSIDIIDQALASPGISVTPQPPTAPYVIQLNTAAPPFDDIRAREAIYYATDVNAIRSGLFNDRYPV